MNVVLLTEHYKHYKLECDSLNPLQSIETFIKNRNQLKTSYQIIL